MAKKQRQKYSLKTSEQLEQLYKERTKLRAVKLWREHPLNWITGYDPIGQRPLLYTVDSHDEKEPVKPFPVTKPIVALASAWYDFGTGGLAVTKSRQLKITWCGVALHLWLAMMNEARLVLVQSKHKAATMDIIARFRYMYQLLPDWVQTMFPTVKPIHELGKSEIAFKNMSRIIGLPRGAAQLRLHTASAVWFDEYAFMIEQSECHTASIPTVAGGGRLLITTTPAPATYWDDFTKMPEDGVEKIDQHVSIIKQRIEEIYAGSPG
jgi:hypothetical protein